MRRLTVWLAVAVAACVTVTAHGGGLQFSSSDPRQFALRGDGDLLYVLPGNQGEAWLREEPGGNPGNLEAWQDVYCDSRWLDLDAEGYDFRAADVETTGAQEYWERLEGFVGSCTFSGDVPFFVVTDSFVREWVDRPELVEELTSHVRTYARKDLLDPTIVFRPGQWTAGHEALRAKLAVALPEWPIGAYVTPESQGSMPKRIWSFVVGEEEIISTIYRGQGAPAWMRAQFGEVAVMIAPKLPDFQRDMVWIGGGAAGIWFRPLPETGTVENQHAAIHLRATSTFLNRFGVQPIQLQPQPGHEGLNFSLKAGDEGWAGVVRGGVGEGLELPVPEDLQGRVVGTNWFNPATDENIIAPITRVTSDSMRVKLPDSSLWVYSMVATSAAPDTATTVSAIRELY